MAAADTDIVASMERDPDFWFDDDSVVVVAQGVGFRVHKSMLSRFSPIFREIFALPIDEANAAHGAPVVQVSDSAHDMKCLLQAIYNSRRYVRTLLPYTVSQGIEI